MNEEKNPKKPNTNQQPVSHASAPDDRHTDDGEHSYPGRLDKVEGALDNGETGGGRAGLSGSGNASADEK